MKLPRTVVRGSDREATDKSKSRAGRDAWRTTDAPDAVSGDLRDSVCRLADLCRNPSPADSSLRLERIVTIQKAIAAGTYRISAADIAEKLIGHMLVNRPPRT